MNFPQDIWAHEHFHVCTMTQTGNEFGNAIYSDRTEAAQIFLRIAQDVTKNMEVVGAGALHIGNVMHSLDVGYGAYAGTSGLIIMIAKCDKPCVAQSWN